MKRALVLCLLLFGCQYYLGPDWHVHNRNTEQKERWELERLSVLLYLTAQPGLVWDDCRANSGPRNPVYPTYWMGFLQDNFHRQAPVLSVRGDSTQDLANSIPGHFSQHTVNRAVSGNTACDMLEQLPATPQRTQLAILISTYGGNDLLRGMLPAEVSANVIRLLNQTRAVWPDAKIVGVGIHPTRVSSAAALSCTVNQTVRAHLAGMANACDVDPYPVFGKACGEQADVSQLLPNDLIHYTAAMAGALKSAIRNQCGVEL